MNYYILLFITYIIYYLIQLLLQTSAPYRSTNDLFDHKFVNTLVSMIWVHILFEKSSEIGSKTMHSV